MTAPATLEAPYSDSHGVLWSWYLRHQGSRHPERPALYRSHKAVHGAAGDLAERYPAYEWAVVAPELMGGSFRIVYRLRR